LSRHTQAADATLLERKRDGSRPGELTGLRLVKRAGFQERHECTRQHHVIAGTQLSEQRGNLQGVAAGGR
jgi:hypothetical protein